MLAVIAMIYDLLLTMFCNGIELEVMQRIAVPILGGMVSVTFLMLVVIPAMFLLWRQGQESI
tara:strand:+ start:1261 stop:1446 length:186 start_codon:yes stop_codon:yes gene_type:complete